MNRRRVLILLLTSPAALYRSPSERSDPDLDLDHSTRWIDVYSDDYTMNRTPITTLVNANLSTLSRARAVQVDEVTNRILTVEKFATNPSDTFEHHDVAHLGIIWPCTLTKVVVPDTDPG